MSSSKIQGRHLDNDYKLKQINVTLLASGWSTTSPYTQTVQVEGVTPTNIVICSFEPTASNIEAIGECKVVATAQAVDAITFTAFESIPITELKFNLLVGGED